MRETIKLTKQRIEEMADAFYQNKAKEGYEKVNEVITCLMNLNQQTVEAVGSGKLSDYNQQHFIQILTEAMGALEQKDTVLLSDILQYDMMEELEELENRL